MTNPFPCTSPGLIRAFLNALLTQDRAVPGGCSRCSATQRLTQDGLDRWHIDVAHLPGCPAHPAAPLPRNRPRPKVGNHDD